MRKTIAWLLVAALAISMCAAAFAEGEAAPEAVTADVIDFEDGNFAFLGLSTAKANADASTVLEIAECNGSKALKVTANGKVPYVALNVEGLLGDRFADVVAISADFAADLASDGKFHAVSGVVYSYTGEDLAETKTNWSVYMAKKNPRSIITNLPSGFVSGAGNYIMISKEDQAGGDPVSFYLDNIQFLDADGNTIPMDLSAVYVQADTGRDTTNLFALTNTVEFEGFTGITGGAWAQNGLEAPDAFWDALVPGSVVEIEYESADGAIWMVMPWAQAGWMRVGGGGNGTDILNNSKTIAQTPYEQIVEYCGEDKETWGRMVQAEGSSDWTVYAVRVGQRANQIVLKNAVEFEGFAPTGAAWAQDGLEAPDAIWDALVPGSVVEITYESENGDIWLVIPWAATGWSRIEQGTTLKMNGKAYVTYEQIAAVCGEDKETWGRMIQCEGSSNWTVFGLRVGQKAEFKAVKNLVELPGFAPSGAAWAQDGIEITEDFKAALVPGAVITVNYESEDGNIWIVWPWAVAGWSRVGNDGVDVADGKYAQVTFDQMAAVCGEDVSTWGAMLQCEGSSNWTVFSLAVGSAVE